MNILYNQPCLVAGVDFRHDLADDGREAPRIFSNMQLLEAAVGVPAQPDLEQIWGGRGVHIAVAPRADYVRPANNVTPHDFDLIFVKQVSWH